MAPNGAEGQETLKELILLGDTLYPVKIVKKLVPPTQIHRATRGLGNLDNLNSPDEETPPQSTDFPDTWLD